MKGKNRLIGAVLFAALIFPMILMVNPAKAQTTTETFKIQADGTVSPANAPLSRNGNIYTLTSDTNAVIIILKSNIILDGAGHTLHGPYNGTQTWIVGAGPNQLPEGVAATFSIGVDFGNKSVTGVTIENLNLENFTVGMYIWTSNNTVTGNSVSGNQIGMLLSGNYNNLTKNFISQNDQAGLFLGINNVGDILPNFTLSQNTFDNNANQFSACVCEEYNASEAIHIWDNGKIGNYWSDYNGADSNGDGIGDTPYIIDPKNQDRFPLMSPIVKLPLEVATPPYLLIGAVLAVVLLVIIGLLVFKKRKK